MVLTFTDKIEDRVVASLILYTVELPSRHLGVIEEVWTDPDYRRQGRARKLMLQAIEYAKKLNLDCIELTVRQDSPTTQDFYKSLGFFDRLNLSYRLKL